MSSLRKTYFAKALIAVIFSAAVMFLVSCSATKHVPKGHYLLDKVKINVTDEKQASDFDKSALNSYLRQNENHKVLGGLKLQLAVYNLSGKDSTNWFNKWLRRIGAAPVIFDSALTVASAKQLNLAVSNRGYMKNQVHTDVKLDSAKKKARVTYDITLGRPYIVRSIAYNIPNDTLRARILADSTRAPIKVGDIFNHNKLDKWRAQITDSLRNIGYFAFTKENITFIADTAANSYDVDLTLATIDLRRNNSTDLSFDMQKPFIVRNVTFVTNYDPVLMHDGNFFAPDTVSYHGYKIFYGKDKYLRKRVLEECCFIKPGQLYNAADVNRTYQAFGRLEILRFVNVEIQPVGQLNGTPMVDAWILLSRDKSQSVSLSLEGTNSEGDLGFGVGLDYTHRNIFKGSEALNAKFKVSYESLSGDLSGLINDHYSEYSAQVGIKFPKFKAPLLTENFKRRIQASTELNTSFSYQRRPAYTRIIAGAGWKYVWRDRGLQNRHTFNLIDLNYVYLPAFDNSFIKDITNPLLLYSYEDHFIMRMGYSFYHTNKQPASLLGKQFQTNIYTIRASAETAGNLLYVGSKIFGQKREDNDSYKLFGIRYSQYFKAEADYSFTHRFSERSSIAFHIGAGVAVPYGNSIVIPFEKRFYAGGANSVRGWGVRTLGPGSYDSSNSQAKFINQCGDIRLDANVEFRAKLFWVIELAAFIDAGNIWTIREYENQPGGKFEFGKFYKQLAAAYGVGLRLDFNYFLLRLDMGMKAHNPADGQEKWPLIHPNYKRDAAFHFSVGYPF